MKNVIVAVVLSSMVAMQGRLHSQEAKGLLKDAKPATGAGEELMEEAKQPRYYEFKLDTPIPMSVRSVVADPLGNKFVALEVRSITFSMDPRDNHLSAVASIVRVGAKPAVRTIHLAFYDKHKRLLGTASSRQEIEMLASLEAPFATPTDVNIDCGMSPRYFAVDSFQVAITGRGRSEYPYSEKDVDELIRRLGDEACSETRYDAALWLSRIGKPAISRLAVLANSDKPAADPAIYVLGEIGGPDVTDALASVLMNTQRPPQRRALAAIALGGARGAGIKFFERRLETGDEEDVLVAIFQGLARTRETRAGEILAQCLLDPKKYYGKTRIRLILSVQDLGDPTAIPALIEALRDPSPQVRAIAASALEKLTKHSIPVKGSSAGSSEMAWLNAPLHAREATVKEWQQWWEANKGRFGK